MNKKIENINSFITVILMIFVFLVGTVCLVGLILSTISFMRNQEMFNEAFSNAAQAIAQSSIKEKDFLQNSIQQLEQIQQIQKNSATNDIMSFIYSTLSTVLVALCAGFVAKSHKNVELSNKAVSLAGSKVKESETNALSSKIQSNAAKDAANKAKKMSKKVEIAFNNMTKEYKATLLDIESQKQITEIICIHIEIIHAHAALIERNKINANARIANIKKRVYQIKKAPNNNVATQLLNELQRLKTTVNEDFGIYVKSITDAYAKKSAEDAVERYNKDLQEAEKYCCSLLS